MSMKKMKSSSDKRDVSGGHEVSCRENVSCLEDKEVEQEEEMDALCSVRGKINVAHVDESERRHGLWFDL